MRVFPKVMMTLKAYKELNWMDYLILYSIFPMILNIWHTCMATVLYQYLIENLFDVSMNTCKIHIQAKDTMHNISISIYLWTELWDWKFWRCPLVKDILMFFEILLEYQAGPQSLGAHIQVSDEYNSVKGHSWFWPESLYFCGKKGCRSMISLPSRSPSSCSKKRSNSWSYFLLDPSQGRTPFSPMDEPLLITELSIQCPL